MHVFSTYESRRAKADEKPFARGITHPVDAARRTVVDRDRDVGSGTAPTIDPGEVPRGRRLRSEAVMRAWRNRVTWGAACASLVFAVAGLLPRTGDLAAGPHWRRRLTRSSRNGAGPIRPAARSACTRTPDRVYARLRNGGPRARRAHSRPTTVSMRARCRSSHRPWLRRGHQAGQTRLDDDVRKYVPELPDYGRPITIRHLIHHTSGCATSTR